MNASHPFFVGEHFYLLEDGTQANWLQFWEERARIGPVITALLQMRSAYEDCLIARQQIRIPKSKRKNILQSSLLRFYWHSFQHHAYIFHEKIGLLLKIVEKLPYDINRDCGSEKLKVLRKDATKKLATLKRARGEIVHGWTREHPAMYQLGMVEILSDASNLGIGNRYDVVGHAQDAATDVRLDIKKWEAQLWEISNELISTTVELLLAQVEQFNFAYATKVAPATKQK